MQLFVTEHFSITLNIFDRVEIENNSDGRRQINLTKEQFENYMQKVFEIAWENDNNIPKKEGE